jgi:hypothetical protein
MDFGRSTDVTDQIAAAKAMQIGRHAQECDLDVVAAPRLLRPIVQASITCACPTSSQRSPVRDAVGKGRVSFRIARAQKARAGMPDTMASLPAKEA